MLDRFIYNNWKMFTYSDELLFFVYLCMFAFCAGFLYGLNK